MRKISTELDQGDWIYHQLHARGKTARGIGQQMDPPRTGQMVGAVIRGKKTSRPVQQAVAAALRMSFKKVWGKPESPKKSIRSTG